MKSVAENWQAIQEQIRAITSQRVRVVAVTKHQPKEKIIEAIAAGINEFGVNYAQAGEVLRDSLQLTDDQAALYWHFIGHIQSRKVRDIINYDCIQSMDRMELVEEFQKRTTGSPYPIPQILVEVNIGKEPQKSGVLPDKLEEFLIGMEKLGVPTAGLMAMPPPLEPVDERAVYFEQLRKLYDQFGPSRKWEILSMGTSDDYLVAIRCGANMVRLGTCLLGKREIRDAYGHVR